MNSSQHKRTRLSQFDYFPIFVDYNFAESKPRGGSTYFDFFSFGKLTALMDEVGKSNIAFVCKEGVQPEKGFFLVDFAKAAADPASFIEAVKKMNLSHIYVESSVKYPLNNILDKDADIAVSYVAFTA